MNNNKNNSKNKKSTKVNIKKTGLTRKSNTFKQSTKSINNKNRNTRNNSNNFNKYGSSRTSNSRNSRNTRNTRNTSNRNSNNRNTSNRANNNRRSSSKNKTRVNNSPRINEANNIIDFNKAQREYSRRNNSHTRDFNSREYASSNINRATSTINNNNRTNKSNENINKNNKNNKNRNTRSTFKKINKRQRNFSTISTVFMSSMFFLIVLYFGASMIKGLDKPLMEYSTIEVGSINNYTQADGIIIRDEVVYSANKDGILTISASQLDKVKINQNIATIKNIVETQETEAELEAIYSEILQIQEKRADLALFSEDVAKLEKQIQNTIEGYIYTMSSGDFGKLYELKEMIDKNITSRNQLLLSENSGSLQVLANQKINKENELNQNIEVFYAQEAGIVSYNMDGYEDIFTIDVLQNITKEQTVSQVDSSAFKLDILSGEEVFKIVKDNTFYIASYINFDNISTWKEGQIKTIHVNDLGTLNPLQVEIETIVHDEMSKEAYVVMKSNNNMIDFIDKRNISFEINIPKEGYKVNLSAIVVEDLLKIPNSYIIGESVVLKKGTAFTEDGVLINTEIDISIAGISKDELYSYISIDKKLLTIGDIIINPNNSEEELQINEIETTEGIYITNTGFNMLKSIDISNSVQDDTYIILDQLKNSNIRLYDRYLQDASSVEFSGGLTFTTPTTEAIITTESNAEDTSDDKDVLDDEDNKDDDNSDETLKTTETEVKISTTEKFTETTTKTTMETTIETTTEPATEPVTEDEENDLENDEGSGELEDDLENYSNSNNNVDEDETEDNSNTDEQ